MTRFRIKIQYQQASTIKLLIIAKERKATKPSRAAKQKRLENKTLRGKIKSLRGRVMI